ncbi:MAG: phage terminase large subunit [Rhodospirillales bacterium]|nr:phage terminase large subunit [Rhodospirillales bacterium]
MPARRLRRGRKVVSPRPSGHDFAPAPAGTAAKPARACAFAAFVWIWNNRQGQPTPRLHLRIARWLADRWEAGDRELLLLAFRNSGKSTLVGLFCAWLLAHDRNLRILVLAGDFALAKKMVRNVKRIIERHPLTAALKPAHADQWASDQFTIRRSAELRDPSMLAKGIAANITGLRADVVICDDVEVPNTCDTVVKRLDLRDRLLELEYVLVPGGLQMYVGTPHTFYSIYAAEVRPEAGEAQPLLASFRRLELPLLDEHGRSRWPERFTPQRIEAIRSRTGPAKFESQMLLRPRNIADGRLDPDRLRAYGESLVYVEGNREAMLSLGGRRLVSASCRWDPAYGAPGKGDGSVVAAVFSDGEGGLWLHGVRYLKHDPARIDEVDEATQLCRQVAAFVGDLYLPAVTLETNGIGRFLPGLLRRELRAAGLRCAVIETTSSRNKDMRILAAFETVLAAGRLSAHRSVWQTPFIEEMREWRPGVRGRDDGLDAVAGCLADEPVRLPRTEAPGDAAHQGWRPGSGGVVRVVDAFEP